MSASGSPLARTLADQPLAEPDDGRRVGRVGQAVRGDAPQLGRRLVEHVEAGDAAAEHRHEARQQPLPELRQRGGALQLARSACDTLAFTQRCSSIAAAPCLRTSTERARPPVSSVAPRERHLLAVVAGGDRLTDASSAWIGFDDPAEGQKAEQAGQQEGRDVRRPGSAIARR